MVVLGPADPISEGRTPQNQERKSTHEKLQNSVEEREGSGGLLILTCEGAAVNKQGGDVVFPSVMVSMEVEELGVGIPLTKPSEAGLLSSDRMLERS
jgi:hypothetical protein